MKKSKEKKMRETKADIAERFYEMGYMKGIERAIKLYKLPSNNKKCK